MEEKKMYYRIRNACGLLGMILPWLALFSAGIAEKPAASWWYSISATYYQTPVLAAILTAAAIVLMTYDGYSKIDNVITTISGVFGLLIVLFPCSVSWLDSSARVGFFQVPMKISAAVHNISAAAFFCLLAFNSLFLFTKHGEEMTKQKKLRNKIYIACGIGMAISLALIVILQLFFRGWVVMIGEILALQFFGFAWLVKGGVFFKDKDSE